MVGVISDVCLFDVFKYIFYYFIDFNNLVRFVV